MDRVFFDGEGAQIVANHAGIGYAPPGTSRILNTGTDGPPPTPLTQQGLTPPTGKPNMAMAGAVVGGSLIEGISSVITTGMNNATQKEMNEATNKTNMDITKINSETTRYGIDKQYSLGTAQLDFSKQQWSKEWQAASDLGLYSPSQLPTLYQGDQTRMYQMSYRSLSSVPRSKHRNMFTMY